LTKVSREQIVAAVQSCARRLGRLPSLAEFERLSGITVGKLRTHFRGIGQAVRSAGLNPQPARFRIDAHALLADWARVAHKLGKLPSRRAYIEHGKYCPGSLRLRFGSWATLPMHFLHFAKITGTEKQWQDVAELVARRMRLAQTPRIPAEAPLPTPDARVPVPDDGGPAEKAPAPARGVLSGRPLAGSPLSLPGLAQEPANEAGVIFVFGMMAQRLGFRVISLQSAFPDCEAMREVKPGRWQRVRVEFEFESRNFKEHGHDPELCDVIVCWQHNWPACPLHLEVVELSRAVKDL
jgi:Homing endonuclease associated repeat